jgi:hypothetical protein
LSELLKNKGFSWDLSKSSKSNNDKKETDIWSGASKFIKDNGKNTAREVIIQRTLSAFEDGRVSVWTSNYSNTHSELRELLKKYFESDNEILTSLSKFIIQSGYVKWVVVDKLLWFLNNKLNSSQVEDIYSLISEHFNLLIRPDIESINKYSWLAETNDTNKTNEQLLVELMIWLLNHPSSDVRNETVKSLFLLGKLNIEIIVKCLINETISNKPTKSTNYSSFILNQLSEKNSAIIINTLTKNVELVDKISAISHLTIYKNYLDISVNLYGQGYTELNSKLKDRFPQNIVSSGSVIIDENFLLPLENKIEMLDELGVLDKNFCLTLKSKVIEFCSPLSPEDFVRADRYIERSFYDNGYINKSYPELLLYALNCAITPRVSKENLSEIFNIINY